MDKVKVRKNYHQARWDEPIILSCLPPAAGCGAARRRKSWWKPWGMWRPTLP